MTASNRQSHDDESQWTYRLSTLFFRDSRALILLVGMVAVSGLTSLAVLPRMEDPVLAQRAGLVVTRLPGADAARVESLVTEPLEDRLQDVEEIKKLSSESRPGICTISIELRDEIVETDAVWAEVRGKIEDTIAELPPDASRPAFDVMEVRAYALIVHVAWDREEPPHWAFLRRYAKRLEDRLQAVPGSELVDRFADPGEEITVVVDPDQAAALGLNASELAAQIGAADAKQSAGLVRTDGRELPLEIGNQHEQSSRISDTLIRESKQGRMVRVADIATVQRGVPSPMPQFAEIDGRPSVALGVMVRSVDRIDRWRSKVEHELDAFEAELPAGLALNITLDQNQYVQSRLSSLTVSLLLGAAAVVLVVLLLMGWRSAVIVAIALPLSGFAVLFGLRVLGIPIHQMSITGMIIALGLLIDNAIVMVDEVVTKIREGERPIDSVASTVHHLALPLTGSTVTTALAFAPIAIMPGPAGEFVRSISVSVILAIFASLLFSLTVIPVLAARFAVPGRQYMNRQRCPNQLRQITQNGFASRGLRNHYRRALTWVFQKPIRGLAISIVLPVVGFLLFTRLPEQFFPPADRDQFHIELELPANASIEATRSTAQQVHAILRDANAEHISWFYGESAPAFYYNVLASRRGVANFASAVVQMESTDGLRDTLRSLQQRVDSEVPNARVLVRQLEQGPPFTSPIEIQVFGPDLDELQRLGDQVRVILASVPEVTHTKSLLGETLPSISLQVDEASARLAGFRPTDVSRQLFDQLEGVSGGRVLEETEQIPVRVRVGEQQRGDLSRIASLELTRGDRLVPLASLAEIEVRPETAVIPRMNRRRMNRIEGYITAGTLPSASLQEFQTRLAESDFQLPVGYSLEYGGEASQRDQAVGNLMANVGVLAVLMIATMVLSFRSFRLASIIFVIATASVGLGMIGLWLGGYPFGFMAIIGTMGLIGVAINDSIVVLAALREHRPRGENAVSETVNIVMRSTRHIVATTLTTIAGFAPLILGGGEFWPPLAIAIAGGVSGATLLALGFAPSAYLLMTNTSRKKCKAEAARGTDDVTNPAPARQDPLEIPHAASVATG